MSINDYDNEYTQINKIVRKYLKSDTDKNGTNLTLNLIIRVNKVFRILKVKHKKCVFKTSQHFNHIIKHEYNIMKSLKDIQPCCPFFTLGYGLLHHKSDFDYKYNENIFDVKRDKYIINDSLLI